MNFWGVLIAVLLGNMLTIFFMIIIFIAVVTKDVGDTDCIKADICPNSPRCMAKNGVNGCEKYQNEEL